MAERSDRASSLLVYWSDDSSRSGTLAIKHELLLSRICFLLALSEVIAGLSYCFIVAASEAIQIVKKLDPSNLIFLLHGPKVLHMLRRSFYSNLMPQSTHRSFSFPFHLDLLGPVLHGVNLAL